ncbi:hypothetical protein HHI36_006855 [Cryptolaemus montrouzieri]|uniref:tRNA (uracil-O(2)-)-methyltransferase n=1 Tax=Cryptolaemus montrouzieri TaxID=559131 RepID=A0ABD2MN24_9CUCU
MYQVPLATSSTLISRENFWKSIEIYYKRPHLANRKIIAADQILFYKVDFNAKNIFDITDILSCHALTYEIRKLEQGNRENIKKDLLKNLLETYDKNVKFEKYHNEDLSELEPGVFLSVRLILPKLKNTAKCVELIVLNSNKDYITFFSACIEKDKMTCLPPFSYRIELTREYFVRITVNNFEDADTKSAEWLADTLFSKLLKWAENSEGNKSQPSLCNVSLEKYSNIYNELKIKYGEPLKKVWWEKTKTSPQKFIFEDISIASYLICIWNEIHSEAKDDVSFIDCGCGNGLLVYILNQEGYAGYGIDLRRRNVWDLFLDKADLRVGVVGPDSIFPEATWLIGNHSDELTPWLPVIALKSSAKTNFFVLPCCPFDFNGKKYIRLNTSVSQYADYLEYIKSISEMCGFDTSIDRLRIPSTKRTCFIGVTKNQNINITSAAEQRIENYINSKYGKGKCEFTPRSSEERVRNCTQIDRNIIDKIVKQVVDILLAKVTLLTKANGSNWNKGGSIHLGDLSRLLPQVDLQYLKKECGGIQTLLRNHRYIFKIEDAEVSLREPYRLTETAKYRDKPCWYNKFHPNGCIYDSEECGYKHC